MNNKIYIYALIILGLLAILSNVEKILGLFFAGNPSKYKLKKDFLTAAETNFYKSFIDYKKDDNPVLIKIRLADIFSTVTTGKERMRDFNRISQKHLDFLVCDKNTLKPLYAIELDDKSHRSEKVQKRDEFVEGIYEQTGLKLIRVQARKDYTEAYLGSLFGRLSR